MSLHSILFAKHTDRPSYLDSFRAGFNQLLSLREAPDLVRISVGVLEHHLTNNMLDHPKRSKYERWAYWGSRRTAGESPKQARTLDTDADDRIRFLNERGSRLKRGTYVAVVGLSMFTCHVEETGKFPTMAPPYSAVHDQRHSQRQYSKFCSPTHCLCCRRMT
jgi:hypothetical protein